MNKNRWPAIYFVVYNAGAPFTSRAEIFPERPIAQTFAAMSLPPEISAATPNVAKPLYLRVHASLKTVNAGERTQMGKRKYREDMTGKDGPARQIKGR